MASHELLSIGYFVPIDQIFGDLSTTLGASDVVVYEPATFAPEPLILQSADTPVGSSIDVPVQSPALGSAVQNTTRKTSQDEIRSGYLEATNEKALTPKLVHEKLLMQDTRARFRRAVSKPRDPSILIPKLPYSTPKSDYASSTSKIFATTPAEADIRRVAYAASDKHLGFPNMGLDDVDFHDLDWYKSMLEEEAQRYSQLCYGLDDYSSKQTLYGMIAVVADGLSDPDVLLSEMHRGRRHNTSENQDVKTAYQAPFAMFGLMTGLWEASPYSSGDALAIVDVTQRQYERQLLRDRSIVRTRAKVDQVYNMSLSHLALHLGTLVPRLTRRPAHSSRPTSGQLDTPRRLCRFADLSTRNLGRVGIKIMWTDTLGQHLEFDKSKGLLYLYSRPTIQAIGLQTRTSSFITNLIDRILVEGDDPSDRDTASFRDLALELLLSYRLIFARHSSSAGLKDSFDFPCFEARVIRGGKVREPLKEDPYLKSCCDHNPLEPLFLKSGIEIEKVPAYFTVNDYPFFGSRLQTLVDYIDQRPPNSLMQLWNDRRDAKTWFAIWAVIILGFGVLSLQLVQIALQAF